ncbi:hypothetical protein DCC62_02735 [candidate division KSB1 bacterium]|nr:MAG: hypothetical protein DCC62_02735 [candidate division KSB1 bacterium]
MATGARREKMGEVKSPGGKSQKQGRNAIMTKLHCISLPTPFPVGPVNVYLAKGEPLTLIDTGPKTEATRAALSQELARLGYNLPDLKQIILTHHHVDHLGLAGEIAAQSNAKIFAHPYNLPWLHDYASTRKHHAQFYRGFWKQNGVPQELIERMLYLGEALTQFRDSHLPVQPLPEGQEIHFAGCDWSVYHTPGHAGGLICLWHAQSRTLISNDHILKNISSNPILEPPMSGEATRPQRLRDYLREMNRMAELNPQIAYTGHGQAVRNVRELVARRVAFHHRRAEAILSALGARTMSLWELTQELFPALTNDADFFLAISEVQGHLDLLQNDQRIVETFHGEKVLWKRQA